MKIKNINDLRDEAIDIVADLRKGAIDRQTAQEVNRGLNVVMNSVKLELTYAKDRKVEPNIDFMKV